MTGYMDASDAAYDVLRFLVAVRSAEVVLYEFFDCMSVDMQVELVHDFIKYNDVDMSEMNDDTMRTIEEFYKRAVLREWRKNVHSG